MKNTNSGFLKKELQFEPIINIDKTLQKKLSISENDLKEIFPSYLVEKSSYSINTIQLKCYQTILFFVKLFVKQVLRPRKDQVGNLDKKEVEAVYTREAKKYFWKHHMTTAGNDSKWRADAALSVTTYYRNNKSNPLKLLDICTGTGHTSQMIAKLSKLWNINIDITAIDYCEEMLNQAKIAEKEHQSGVINFVRADATNMSDKQKDKDFTFFSFNEFDLATQMFGIGGIDKPLDTFKEVLKILKNGGHYHISDMHRPIKELAGEMHFFGFWKKFPSLEMMCYEEVTIPLALNLLWGWRDTTNLFYLIPLATLENEGNFYGFELIDFGFKAQNWFLGLPFVPTAKGVYKKTRISKEEFQKRNDIMSLVT